jgi:hypothetical protein
MCDITSFRAAILLFQYNLFKKLRRETYGPFSDLNRIWTSCTIKFTKAEEKDNIL